MERHFRKIIGWCDTSGVISDPELRRCATLDIRRELAVVAESLQADPFKTPGVPLMEVLRASEQAGYIRSAGTIWGHDYDAVAFRNREELKSKVQHFLIDPSDREHTAQRIAPAGARTIHVYSRLAPPPGIHRPRPIEIHRSQSRRMIPN